MFKVGDKVECIISRDSGINGSSNVLVKGQKYTIMAVDGHGLVSVDDPNYILWSDERFKLAPTVDWFALNKEMSSV